MSENSNPKAFTSYSWEDDAHKEWVRELAARLRSDGIEAILDQWDANLGDQQTEFMEQSIREADFVVIVCTPEYKDRSDRRVGGVGYEGDIITGEIITRGEHRKFIPVLRQGSWLESAPTWLAGKIYADLSNDPYSEDEYQKVVSTLHGEQAAGPAVGNYHSASGRGLDLLEMLITNPNWETLVLDQWSWARSQDELDFKEELRDKLLMAKDLMEQSKHLEVLTLYDSAVEDERFNTKHPDWANQPYIRAHIHEGKQMLFLAHMQLASKDTEKHAPPAFQLLREVIGNPPYSMEGIGEDRLLTEEARNANETYLQTLLFANEWIEAFIDALQLYGVNEAEIGIVVTRIEGRVSALEYVLGTR